MNVEWPALPRAWTYGLFEYPNIDNLTLEAFTSSAQFRVEVDADGVSGYWCWEHDGMSEAHYALWRAAQAVTNPLIYIAEVLEKCLPDWQSEDDPIWEDDDDDDDWTP